MKRFAAIVEGVGKGKGKGIGGGTGGWDNIEALEYDESGRE